MLWMIEKLRNCFDEMVVYKDLKKSNLFSSLSLPSFMRDWLLKRFEDENGHFESDDLVQFVRTYLPRKDDWTAIKNRVIIENERVKFLAKISSDIAIKTGEVSFSLPDFGLSSKDTIIEDMVWDNCKNDLVRGRET
jgi:ATP-dependent Lon protease